MGETIPVLESNQNSAVAMLEVEKCELSKLSFAVSHYGSNFIVEDRRAAQESGDR